MSQLRGGSLFSFGLILVIGFVSGSVIAPSLSSAASCSSHTEYGGSGDDQLLGGETTQDTLWGYDGNDEILGYGCDDFLHGGAAGDNIHGATGADDIYGGDGSEYYTVCGDWACGEIVGGNQADYVEAGDGQDYVYSNSNLADSDVFYGEGGNGDYVESVDTDTADRIFGGQGTSDRCAFDYFQNTTSPDYTDNSCETLLPQ